MILKNKKKELFSSSSAGEMKRKFPVWEINGNTSLQYTLINVKGGWANCGKYRGRTNGRRSEKLKIFHRIIIVVHLITVAIIKRLRFMLRSLLSVKPENRFQHKISDAKGANDLLPLRPLQVVDLNVQQSAVQLRDLLP